MVVEDIAQERLSRLEGTYEQVDRRLDDMNSRLLPRPTAPMAQEFAGSETRTPWSSKTSKSGSTGWRAPTSR